MTVGNIIHLSGFPGVGKLTVAKRIVERPDHVLVDAHLINNPIFKVIGADGITPLPAEIWKYVGRIREAVLDAIDHFAPKHLTYVLTNVILDDPEDKAVTDRIEAIAVRRGGLYFPIILTCDVEENKQRIIGDDRAANFKCIDPEEPGKMHRGTPLASFEGHSQRLCLDTTHESPGIVAQKILDHVALKFR